MNKGSMSGEIPNIETKYFKLLFIECILKLYKIKLFKLVFTSNKLSQTFTYKDSYASALRSKAFYKFIYASCNASYVGQTH